MLVSELSEVNMDINLRKDNATDDANKLNNRKSSEKNIFTFDQNDVVSLSKSVPPGNISLLKIIIGYMYGGILV